MAQTHRSPSPSRSPPSVSLSTPPQYVLSSISSIAANAIQALDQGDTATAKQMLYAILQLTRQPQQQTKHETSAMRPRHGSEAVEMRNVQSGGEKTSKRKSSFKDILDEEIRVRGVNVIYGIDDTEGRRKLKNMAIDYAKEKGWSWRIVETREGKRALVIYDENVIADNLAKGELDEKTKKLYQFMEKKGIIKIMK